jgi:beta-lactamase regulating signal transducer with metallopeptidase domain
MRTILTLSAAGSVLALAVLAGGAIFRNRVSRTFSYYIWLLVLLRLALPLPSPFRFGTPLPQPRQSAAITETAAPQTAPSGIAAARETPSGAGTARNGQTVWRWLRKNAAAVWALGAGACVCWYLAAYLRFSRRIRRSCGEPDEEDARIFESARGNQNVRLARSRLVSTPVLTGAFRPLIVLPPVSYAGSGRGGELRYILKHELTHARRRDILYKWAVVLVTAAHWFNPLMPFLRRAIEQDCELSCDEAVIRGLSGDERREYAGTLLAGAAAWSMPAGSVATSLCEGKKQLKKRLSVIVNYRKKTRSAAALMVVLAILLTGCAAALGARDGTISMPAESGSSTAPSAAQSSAPAAQSAAPSAAQSTAASPAPAAASDGTGPFAAYWKGGPPASLEVYTEKNGAYLRSLPGALLAQFPGMENAADGWLDGLDVYCGAIGDFVWAAAATGPHLGTGTQNVCTSSDGGKTWSVENAGDMYAGTVTGAGFASPDAGFLCFRYFFDQGPEIARTLDGGKTWARMKISLPDALKAYNLTPLVPVFDGESGAIPVEASAKDGSGGTWLTRLATADGGRSWQWDAASLPKASVETLLGSARYADGQIAFRVPSDFPDPENLNIHIAGRAKYSDGFSRSLHYLEDVNAAKSWTAGKTYSFPYDAACTELTMTVFCGGAEESVDLLGLGGLPGSAD